MSTSKCRSTSSKSRSDDTFSVRKVNQVPSLQDFVSRLFCLIRRLKPPVNQMSSLRDYFAGKPIRHNVGDTTLIINAFVILLFMRIKS